MLGGADERVHQATTLGLELPELAQDHQFGAPGLDVPCDVSADRRDLDRRYRRALSSGRVAFEVSKLIRRAGYGGFGPPPYCSVMASPLRSAFAIKPTCLPDSSSTAPF